MSTISVLDREVRVDSFGDEAFSFNWGGGLTFDQLLQIAEHFGTQHVDICGDGETIEWSDVTIETNYWTVVTVRGATRNVPSR